MSSIMTVTQINRYMKFLVDGDSRLLNVMITGEISNFKGLYSSGHLYFTLKDSASSISCVMFSDNAKRLIFRPQDGMKVIVAGRISVYEQQGRYQVYVKSMQPDGLGALKLAYEQLKDKLESEGLFGNNRSFPEFPKKIAVITSENGAVFHDIQNVTKRRWPLTEILLIPSAVQGEYAESQLVNAVKKANAETDCDLIIIGRGGGSMEDLWCFNSEKLARTIYESRLPVISAVGHDTDFTICDFVSDYRAPTPSAAAEVAVPDIQDIFALINNLSYSLKSYEIEKINSLKQDVDILSGNRYLHNPEMIYGNYKLIYEELHKHLINAQNTILEAKKAKLAENYGKLTTLNPMNVLLRGYSLVTQNGNNIYSVEQIDNKETINIKMSDGKIIAEIKDIIKET